MSQHGKTIVHACLAVHQKSVLCNFFWIFRYFCFHQFILSTFYITRPIRPLFTAFVFGLSKKFAANIQPFSDPANVPLRGIKNISEYNEYILDIR
jgi:hypothetical protein